MQQAQSTSIHQSFLPDAPHSGGLPSQSPGPHFYGDWHCFDLGAINEYLFFLYEPAGIGF